MAASQRCYAEFFLGILSGTYAVDWASDTIKCALVTSSYTPNLNSDQYWSTPQTDEVANGNGYATGGVTLADCAAAIVGGSSVVEFTANAAEWTGSTFTWRYAVIYKSTGTAGTSPLIALFDPGGTEEVTAGTATITFDASGVFKVAY